MVLYYIYFALWAKAFFHICMTDNLPEVNVLEGFRGGLCAGLFISGKRKERSH